MAKIGKSRTPFPNVERYIDSYGKKIIRMAKRILKQKKGSTKLERSLKYLVTYKKGKGYTIEFKSADHGKFIDEGVRGIGKSILLMEAPETRAGERGAKMRPNRTYIDPITGKRKRSPNKFRSRHIKRGVMENYVKGFSFNVRDKDGKDTAKKMSIKSMAFIVGRSIKAKGIQGISFYSQPVAAMRAKLRRDLMTNFGEDFLRQILINVPEDNKIIK